MTDHNREEREARIKQAETAIHRAFLKRGGYRGAAEAAFTVFEQAHTPTDDEREALANLIPLDLVHDRGREGFPQDAFEAADAILAAGFRRTVQGEPTAAQVDAAAREAFFTDDAGGHIRGGWTWDTIPEQGRENYRTMVRGVLHAALRAAAAVREEGGA